MMTRAKVLSFRISGLLAIEATVASTMRLLSMSAFRSRRVLMFSMRPSNSCP